MLGDSIAAANSKDGYRGVDPENPYGYQGTNGGITNWRTSAVLSIGNAYNAPGIAVGGQEPDYSWIGEGLPPANPYANLSMRDGVQLASDMTGGMLFGKSGQLTPDGPNVDLPKTRVAPVLDVGALREITVAASAGASVGLRSTGGRGELSSSAMYAAGYGDIRMTETPIPSRPYEPFERGVRIKTWTGFMPQVQGSPGIRSG